MRRRRKSRTGSGVWWMHSLSALSIRKQRVAARLRADLADAARLAHYDELMGRYNRIAEAADSAAANAGHAGTIVHAQVWADEIAKLDGDAS